jgi:hypothetical protein
MSNSQPNDRIEISAEVLQERQRYLETDGEPNLQRLAKAFARERQEVYGEEKNPLSARDIIKKAIANPHRSTLRTLNCLVRAMGGRIYIEWGSNEKERESE